jgi:phosphonopyruvate decarboxylase
MTSTVRQADPVAFLAGLKRGGIELVTGVPCSSMTGLMNAVLDDPDLVFANAPNEGEALAFAAGAKLGGRDVAVLCQNSGLSNLSNALTSLIVPYRIPALLIVGWRGQPGIHDEPQHSLTGRLTRPLLKACGVETHVADPDNAAELAEHCARVVGAGGPSQAILVPIKLFRECPATRIDAPMVARIPCAMARDGIASGPTRPEVLRALLEILPDDALIIAPTGLTSRELFHVKDAPSRFYMMGSMGHASALGLGVAATTARPVTVLDGDGSVLMRLGSLAFAGARAPENLLHIVLDNGIHESTGAQASLSASTDLCAIAAACGYRFAAEVHSMDMLKHTACEALSMPGPSFVRVFTRVDQARIPPRIFLSADAIAARFSSELVACDKVIDSAVAGAAE